MRALFHSAALCLILPLAGCAARGNVDALEGQLRRSEDRIADLEARLREASTELQVTRREANDLRAQLTGSGQQPALLPEQAAAFYRATGIRFNSLMTGGFDRDGQPGDETLTALLVPHDANGETVKVPGRIDLELLDMTLPADSRAIGRWTFPAERSSEFWHRGFLATGYLFTLPWQQPPTSSRLLLHGRLTTTDGRQFDTTHEIQVSVPKPAATPPLATAPPAEFN